MSERQFPFELPAVSKQMFEIAAAQVPLEQESELSNPLSQQFLKQTVYSHLSGFVYRNLSPVKAAIDLKSWQQLELQYVQILRGNHQFLALHQQMVQLLESNNIPFAVLKGLDLLFRTYREEGIRHISDIDVLIAPKDLNKVKSIFIAVGAKIKEVPPASKFHERFESDHAPVQIIFNNLNIDLHISLFNTKMNLNFDINELIQNREKITWKNEYTYCLSAKDSALFILLHLHKHLTYGNALKMSSFIDVQRTIHELNYPANKAQYSTAIQEKIENVIDCMVWLGLIKDNFLPQRKKAPARYFFYLLFFLQTLQPTFIQTLRYKFFPRLFLYSFSWKTLPLLFHEAFPSKRYLLYGAPNRSYLSAWIYRLKHFTRKK
jgi:hypothetical protein